MDGAGGTPPGRAFTLLYGVSCPRRNWCMAVGYSISKASARSTLTEIWTGQHWSIRPAPSLPGTSNTFTDISCTSPVRCTAAGGSGNLYGAQQPLAENWNGTHWTVQPVPAPAGQAFSQLLGVGCATAKACIAVGQYMASTGFEGTFAESWNGTGWHLQKTVNPSRTINELQHIACRSATTCTAVGGYAGPGSVSRTLAEHYSS